MLTFKRILAAWIGRIPDHPTQRLFTRLNRPLPAKLESNYGLMGCFCQVRHSGDSRATAD
jgi:hypothetical protein